jgi:MFS family permease
MRRDAQFDRSLRKRLRPLHIATLLVGLALWVPVEKLFMTEIGFSAASIGVMAAVYAAVPPIIEIPSGILADRWSRRGVLILSSVAATASVLIGGLSNNVATYFVSAFFLGVFFAMRSGTLEAVVYDTVLEETGGSDDYERRVGRVRAIESVALVASALAGGLLAGLTSPRLMYFLTLPFTVLSIIAFLRFREPQLHKAAEPTSLRTHLAVTYRTVARTGQLRSIVALSVLTALIITVIFEFGPLWLVAIAASAALYGPHWAGLVSTLGLGGLVAGRVSLDRPAPLAGVSALMVAASVALTATRNVLAVTIAQVVLLLLVVAVSIHVSRLLHDAVASAVRSSVASGVGAVSWMAFLPFALAFGVVSDQFGVYAAAWMIAAVAVLVGLLLARVSLREPVPTTEANEAAVIDMPVATTRVFSAEAA